MKKIVRLTENDLHRIVNNSVKRIIKEDRPMKKYKNSKYENVDEIENLIGGIQKNAELLLSMINNKQGFYDNKQDFYNVGGFGTEVMRLLDSYGFINGGFLRMNVRGFPRNPTIAWSWKRDSNRFQR